jgi:hypothetical protein
MVTLIGNKKITKTLDRPSSICIMPPFPLLGASC